MDILFSDTLNLVPAQTTGGQELAHATHTSADLAAAKVFYQVVRDRLLDVNNWHAVAGIISAQFQLTDANAEEIFERASNGNYIRINIPGPGSKEETGTTGCL